MGGQAFLIVVVWVFTEGFFTEGHKGNEGFLQKITKGTKGFYRIGAWELSLLNRYGAKGFGFSGAGEGVLLQLIYHAFDAVFHQALDFLARTILRNTHPLEQLIKISIVFYIFYGSQSNTKRPHSFPLPILLGALRPPP